MSRFGTPIWMARARRRARRTWFRACRPRAAGSRRVSADGLGNEAELGIGEDDEGLMVMIAGDKGWLGIGLIVRLMFGSVRQQERPDFMNDVVSSLRRPFLTWGQVRSALAGGLGLSCSVVTLLLVNRAGRGPGSGLAAERAREMDDKVADLTRLQAEMTGGCRRSPRCSEPVRAISSA